MLGGARFVRSIGVVLVVALYGLGCSEESGDDSTRIILLNSNRADNLTIETAPPTGGVWTVTLPRTDVLTGYGPAVDRYYSVSTGDVFRFTARWASITTTQQCTVTENMIPASGATDPSRGWGVVTVLAAQQQVLLLCNW